MHQYIKGIIGGVMCPALAKLLQAQLICVATGSWRTGRHDWEKIQLPTVKVNASVSSSIVSFVTDCHNIQSRLVYCQSSVCHISRSKKKKHFPSNAINLRYCASVKERVPSKNYMSVLKIVRKKKKLTN